MNIVIVGGPGSFKSTIAATFIAQAPDSVIIDEVAPGYSLSEDVMRASQEKKSIVVVTRDIGWIPDILWSAIEVNGYRVITIEKEGVLPIRVEDVDHAPSTLVERITDYIPSNRVLKSLISALERFIAAGLGSSQITLTDRTLIKSLHVALQRQLSGFNR